MIVRLRFTTVVRARKPTTDVESLSLISSCGARLFSVSLSLSALCTSFLTSSSVADFEQALAMEPHNVLLKQRLALARMRRT